MAGASPRCGSLADGREGLPPRPPRDGPAVTRASGRAPFAARGGVQLHSPNLSPPRPPTPTPVLANARYALRALRRAPGFTAVAELFAG